MKVPTCVNCKKEIWGKEVGYFFLNLRTNKFDLYCSDCQLNFIIGKDTV